MPVRNGKTVSISARVAGPAIPQFHLFRNAGDAVAYEFVAGAGDGFRLDTDTSIVIWSNVSVFTDIRAGVFRSFTEDADISIRVACSLLAYSDIKLVIARDYLADVDTMISIIHSDANKTETPVPDHTLEFLGKGLRFPFTFQRRSGGAQISTATSSDHAHIHESIRQILGTRKGERFMRPEFGTRLHELIFEPNDRLLYGLIRHEVMEAIDLWEPRVIVRDVVVSQDSADGHLVLVDIRYRLISSQVIGNLVYPFYRELE